MNTNKFRNTLRAIALLATTILPLRAVVLTANFDAIPTGSAVGTSYSENGIAISSPTNLSVATGFYGAMLFGGGGPAYVGNALSVANQGWVSIGASAGQMIDSVSFVYGFDWSFMQIEYGLMDVNVEWQAYAGGNLLDAGGLHFDRDHRSHGGGGITANPIQAFDTLLIRSTAVAYQGIYTGGTGPGGWFFERGDVMGYGDANHIAFDTVSLTTMPSTAQSPQPVSAPDAGSAAALFAVALGGIMAASACRRQS